MPKSLDVLSDPWIFGSYPKSLDNPGPKSLDGW